MKNLGRLLAVLVLFATPAFSQNRDIVLFAGAQKPGKVTLKTGSGATDILSNPTNAGMFGIRIGHGRVWGGEHTIAFTSKFLDSDSKSFIYNSNFRIQAPLPVIKPYFTAGLGTVMTWGTGISDIGSKFAVNYGGGVSVLPAGPVGLRLDIRGYAIPRVQSQTLQIAEVSAGIVFAF